VFDVTISQGTVLGTHDQEVIASFRHACEKCPRCDCSGFGPCKRCTWCGEHSSLMRNLRFFGAESKLFEVTGG
jgi:Zn-dependent alcohol dehydrogenase